MHERTRVSTRTTGEGPLQRWDGFAPYSERRDVDKADSGARLRLARVRARAQRTVAKKTSGLSWPRYAVCGS